MPTTVNGIGTHYYGMKNSQARTGICRACGASATLQSYDTRLWFVVVFIPVIPLGRKRIVDQCSNCKRHWVMSQQQWETSKELHVKGAMDRYRAQPSVEAALELHGQFLGFQMLDEAEKFRQAVLPMYSDSAVLLAGMAEQMEQMSQFSEATPLFERALELRSDMPEARVGVARRRMAEGKLDEARDLLGFLAQPAASQLYSLGPLEHLAHAYQNAGRHDETLRICQHLLLELPAAGNIHAFRKFVSASEKALNRSPSILPPRTFSMRGLFDARSGTHPAWHRWATVAAIIAIVAAFGMAGVNEYKRRHRTVFVLSEFSEPVQVAIDGGDPVHVLSRTKLEVPEGRHHVAITGPVTEEFDIDMHTGYFDRWTKDPVWVVNTGGASALILATIHYAAQPHPADVQVAIADSLFYFPHVDYPFQAPPHSLKVDNTSKEVTKTHLDRASESSNILFAYALANADRTAALRFAESHLRRIPDDVELLEMYTLTTRQGEDAKRAEAFLKSGLWRKPISVPWHRAYQHLRRDARADAAMAAEYDAELQKEPSNASLLYLRGRVSGGYEEENEFFRQANTADPNLPWPYLALAYDAASRAEWQESQSLTNKAFDLKLRDPSLQQLRHLVRLAVGDSEELQTEYRQQLSSERLLDAYRTVANLCDVLAVQGKSQEASTVISAWQTQLGTSPTDGIAQELRGLVHYMLGEFAEFARNTGHVPNQPLSGVQFHMLLATGHPVEAASNPSVQETTTDAFDMLALSLAFHLSGQTAEAGTWAERACTKLQEQGADSRRTAALLRSAEPPSQKELDAVVLYPGQKALLATALAARFPEQRAELHALASRLNVSRFPPHHLVRKAIDADRGVHASPVP